MTDNVKIITRNRKASHDYHIGERFEAGIVFTGSEIKSVRAGHINLSDGFVAERDGELWLMNVHISPYEQSNIFGHRDPLRPRKILLHKREIAEIISWTREKGYTVVPTAVYLKQGLAKVEIGLARGKKAHDKRDATAEREANRQIHRAMKGDYE